MEYGLGRKLEFDAQREDVEQEKWGEEGVEVGEPRDSLKLCSRTCSRISVMAAGNDEVICEYMIDHADTESLVRRKRPHQQARSERLEFVLWALAAPGSSVPG